MALQPGSYTAVVRDRTGQPGLGLVEIYDLASKDSLLANISTRGKVETVDNVMIGGFIIGGNDPTRVLVRGQNNTTGVALVEVYNLDVAGAASK